MRAPCSACSLGERTSTMTAPSRTAENACSGVSRSRPLRARSRRSSAVTRCTPTRLSSLRDGEQEVAGRRDRIGQLFLGPLEARLVLDSVQQMERRDVPAADPAERLLPLDDDLLVERNE